MTAVAMTFDRSWLRLSKRDWLRGVLAGAVWGTALTLGLTAMTAWSCGGVCLSELAVNAGLSLAGGIFAFGPLAAYGRR